MNESCAGTYFSGRDGQAHAVELRRVGKAHFAVVGDGIERNGALRDLAVTPRLARVARTIEFADGARLQLDADAPVDAWFAQRDRLEAFVDRLERHAHAVAAAIVICLAGLGAGVAWGIPWLADRIAAQIPANVERSIGTQVMESLDHFGMLPSHLNPVWQDELSARFAGLVQGLPGHEHYHLEFRDAPGVGANAFAVPGGTVVVTDQLMKRLVDNREFDAVVAHEIGHQQYRHTLRQTLRGSLVAIVAAVFAGDVSSASAVVVAVPTFLLDSHYSRRFESEADAFAFDLLARHDESPHWFALTMRALSTAAPEYEMSYLSSHPPTIERIDAAEAAAHAFALAHPQLCPDGICPGDEIEPEDAVAPLDERTRGR